jgi:hypothetical protein
MRQRSTLAAGRAGADQTEEVVGDDKMECA